MVGAVLQAALARQYCYLPERFSDWRISFGYPENNYQILHSVLYSLHKETVSQVEEEISNNARDHEGRVDKT